jgi:nitrile hydratase
MEHAFVTRDELERQRPGPAGRAPLEPGALRARDVPGLLWNRRAARRDDPVPPGFAAGDRVVARNLHPAGHTRLPRYVRGHRGVIARDHGVFVFPDTHALGLGEAPQHVYSVRFEGRELWGPDAPAPDAVYVDLWEAYLDRA